MEGLHRRPAAPEKVEPHSTFSADVHVHTFALFYFKHEKPVHASESM